AADRRDPQGWGAHVRRAQAPTGLAQDGLAEPVEEVLGGGLGHPVEQDPVGGQAGGQVLPPGRCPAPSPTAPSSPSPRRWATPAISASQPGGWSSKARSTCAA